MVLGDQILDPFGGLGNDGGSEDLCEDHGLGSNILGIYRDNGKENGNYCSILS